MDVIKTINDYMMQHNDFVCIHKSQLIVNEFTYYELTKYSENYIININTKNIIYLSLDICGEYYHGKIYENTKNDIKNYIIIADSVYQDVQAIRNTDIMDIDRKYIGLYININKGIIIPNFE